MVHAKAGYRGDKFVRRINNLQPASKRSFSEGGRALDRHFPYAKWLLMINPGANDSGSFFSYYKLFVGRHDVNFYRAFISGYELIISIVFFFVDSCAEVVEICANARPDGRCIFADSSREDQGIEAI